MTAPVSERIKSVRGWLAFSVIATAAAAWIAVGMAASRVLEFSGRLGVAGIALTLGGVEASFLVWQAWTLRQKHAAVATAVGASLGPVLVLSAVLAGLSEASFAVIAAGVALVGFSCAIGVYGMFKGAGKSSAATAVGMIMVLALAFLSQVLWAQVG